MIPAALATCGDSAAEMEVNVSQVSTTIIDRVALAETEIAKCNTDNLDK